MPFKKKTPKTFPPLYIECMPNSEDFFSKKRSLHSSTGGPTPTTHTVMSVQAIGDLRLGDRVIVTSGQGSKAGTLRFLGNTEFAVGQWAGVELDDPLGKNDGAVAGTRYFDCPPHYGLFAPIHKVSRSPANHMRRPSSGFNSSMSTSRTSAGLPRQGTRDSMGDRASLAGSVASSRASTTASRVSRALASGTPRLGVTSLTSNNTTSPSHQLLSSRQQVPFPPSNFVHFQIEHLGGSFESFVLEDNIYNADGVFFLYWFGRGLILLV